MTWDITQPMVSIKNVHKAFGDLKVLNGVSLDVMKGSDLYYRSVGIGEIHAHSLR